MKLLVQLQIIFLLLFSTSLIAAEDIVGFWKTTDEETNKPESIVAIYEHGGKYFGRIIATYDDKGEKVIETIDNPKTRAPGVTGNPFYAGLDIIWDLKKEGNKYVDGEVLDPEQGKVYGAEAWRQGPNLIMRGQLLFFGRNQTWPPALESDFPSGFKKPNLNELTPKIPEPK